MIDTEVMRLRRLRTTVLRARALAAELDATHSRRNSVFSRTAVNCWQIARVVTGRLRAHPYLNYQRGPTAFDAFCGAGRAALLAMASRYGRRNLEVLSLELQRVARELDDARALTWSAELSDTFGRSQIQIRRLIAELDLSRDSRDARVPRSEARSTAVGDASNVAGNWPYLAF
jgi:hypothetical protein